nr:juvenile hormone acid O-methyltransferase-like [Dermacentor andersoni]
MSRWLHAWWDRQAETHRKIMGLLDDLELMFWTLEGGFPGVLRLNRSVSRNVVTFKPHQFEGDKQLPRQQTRWMLGFCQRLFREEPGETQQFLDVGCGIGDLTREELLPRCLPCRRIVAVDVSADMVEHAARHYHHDRLKFRKLDVVNDEDVAEFIDEHGLFDRVYSFHTVIWVRDQAKALKNMARLLKPHGECLLIFPSSVRSVDVNRNLVRMQRWSKYSHMSDN